MASRKSKISSISSSTGDQKNWAKFDSPLVRCRKSGNSNHQKGTAIGVNSSLVRCPKNESSNCQKGAAIGVNSIPALPEDVLFEILYRVPLKPVIRFRSVSKGWYSLLSTRRFSNVHLMYSGKAFSNTYIMLSRYSCRLWFCPLQTFLYEPLVDAVDAENHSFRKEIVGSCNGIICLAGTHKNDITLWNPSINKRLELPKTPPFGDNSTPRDFFRYGFGFDKSTEDCKVVSFRFPDEYHIFNATVSIYSMRTGQWKRIDDYWGIWFLLKSTKYGNGRIHWVVKKEIEQWGIAYLDLVTERYGVIEKPAHLNGVFDVKLEVSERDLYVLCCTTLSGVVWSLNGYGSEGDNQVWTKLASIPHTTFRYPYNELFQVMKNGDILLKYGSEFVIFNIMDCTLRYPKFRDSPHRTIYDAITYIPSLVSPFALDNETR